MSAELSSAEREEKITEDQPQEATAVDTDDAAQEAATADATTATTEEEAAPAEDADQAPAAALDAIRGAMQSGKAVKGEVTGADDEDLHVVIDGVTAFCPRSEMELGDAKESATYIGQSYDFFVLRIENESDRVVLSRVSHLRQEPREQQPITRDEIQTGAVLTGKVVSIKDFGAFVDLGGVQGLIHISELARRRVERTEDVVQPGDDVQVKVLKVDKGGRRISLSMRALEPDPWKDASGKYQSGSTVEGIVEKVERFGAFVQLEPGLSGLLPSSKMMIPRDSSAARVFPPGRKINVKIVSIDPRRQRISLGLEGDTSEGSREDYESYKQSQSSSSGSFNALAAALSKLK